MMGIKSGMRSNGSKAYPTARPRRSFGSLGVRGSLSTRRYTDNSCLRDRAALRNWLPKVAGELFGSTGFTAAFPQRDIAITRQSEQSLNPLGLQPPMEEAVRW